MEEFTREIARRAEAAADTFWQRRDRRLERRARARGVLADVRRRFVRAALSAKGRLRVHYLDGAHADRAVGYGLTWAGCPPLRELCVRLHEARGVILWELGSTELGLSRTGSAGVGVFRTEFLDRLIYALLDQESWQRAVLPQVAPSNDPTRKDDEGSATTFQESMHGKAAEIRERLHEAAENFRNNVADGVQSAVKRRPRHSRTLGRPPAGRMGAGQPPSAHRRAD